MANRENIAKSGAFQDVDDVFRILFATSTNVGWILLYAYANVKDSALFSQILVCLSLMSLVILVPASSHSQALSDATLYKTRHSHARRKQRQFIRMSSSLSDIEAKLNELVKMQREKSSSKASRATTDGQASQKQASKAPTKGESSQGSDKEQTQEEKDEARLREIDSKITDLVDLLHAGVTRASADAKVDEHRTRERASRAKGEPRSLQKVFHDHGGKRIATTTRTQVRYGIVFRHPFYRMLFYSRVGRGMDKLRQYLEEKRELATEQTHRLCALPHITDPVLFWNIEAD
jgi:hypothetical protein